MQRLALWLVALAVALLPVAAVAQGAMADPALHAKADALVASGHVYRDYSTEQERAAEKAKCDYNKVPYRFREQPTTEEQRAQYEKEGRTFALRFRVPQGKTVVVKDLIKGDVEQKTEEMMGAVARLLRS